MVDGSLLCVFFILSSLSILSLVSVVFDFSASLSDVAPVSPILLTVYAMGKEKNELLMDVLYVPSFFCIHNLNQAQ